MEEINPISKHHDISELSALEGSALSVNEGIAQPPMVSPEQLSRFLALKKRKKTPQELLQGVLQGDRTTLGQAITLVESGKLEDQQLAREVVEGALPHSGKAIRIGITGVPGAGKSTFIEAFGLYLLSLGKKVAVMAVDPSSSKSGGSLLGDKTRMEQLSAAAEVFIRPSATGGFLGGVNRATREAMILCEAAGYEVILVETVGVGQSETMVHSMVDFFLLLELAGAGDEIQGMKKGIMEMADAIAISKADGDNLLKAQIARQERENALHYSSRQDPDWRVPVLLCSSLQKSGIEQIWETITRHLQIMQDNGRFYQKRHQQLLSWFESTLLMMLQNEFFGSPAVSSSLEDCRLKVQHSRVTPIKAASELLKIFKQHIQDS